MSYKRFFGAKTRMVTTRKPAKRWFCRVFAWRPFASPGKDTTNSSRKRNAWNVAYFRVAGRKVAMRKHEKVIIWRVFACRPFAFSPLFVVSLPGGAKDRHAKTLQMVIRPENKIIRHDTNQPPYFNQIYSKFILIFIYWLKCSFYLKLIFL